ncbi:unnamed protein product [Staurois parvus]|uniref:Uncharacterized protein n=1 Tax=Staurois parvus TaxID=386267 RepID=A0ABN9AWP6_9NEOB|nr:unnamed protein product [Staurois parvus]
MPARLVQNSATSPRYMHNQKSAA